MSLPASNDPKKFPIGFLGLGQLGAPMVTNLLADGYRVRVYNRTAAKAAPLVAAGAELVACPEDLAEPGAVLMTCVSDDAALESVFDAHPALFERLGRDGVHVSMSTIAPKTARRLAERHAVAGGMYVASPVMGRPDAVAARMQLYLLSGPEPAAARVRPVLQGIARNVFDFGEDPCTATTAKLCANFLIASAIEAMAEAFTLAEKNGLPPALLHAMLIEGIFACPIYANYGRQLVSGKVEQPLFQLALGLKDMRLVAQTASESDVPMPLGSLVRDRLTSAFSQGRGNWDWTGILKEVRTQAGLPDVGE